MDPKHILVIAAHARHTLFLHQGLEVLLCLIGADKVPDEPCWRVDVGKRLELVLMVVRLGRNGAR